MQGCWTKNTIWILNRKNWSEMCIFVSHFLFNNRIGLPGLTIGTTCPNLIFYVWLVDLQTICAKYGLETWLSKRWYFLDMQRSCTQHAFWDVNNNKWRKWCKFNSPFLFSNPYGSPVLTMGTKCPNQVFYVWLVDIQNICAKYGLETWLTPNNDIRIYLLDMRRS
jgi:hypothetical protein